MVLNCNEVGEKVNPGVDSIVRTGSLASPDGYMETRDFARIPLIALTPSLGGL